MEFKAGLTDERPEYIEDRYAPDEINKALLKFCTNNSVRCKTCRTYFNGIGNYCTGSDSEPKIGKPDAPSKRQALRELEALWYLPPGKIAEKSEKKWHSEVIIKSKRLKMMKSGIIRLAIERQIETEIDSGPYESPRDHW